MLYLTHTFLFCTCLVQVVVMSAKNLKAATGQGKTDIRPIQRSLSVIPLKSETSSFSTSVLKWKCVYCLKEFLLQSLRVQMLTCLSSSYLSDDDTDDVREEDSAPSDDKPSNDNISESIRSLEVSTIFQTQKSLILPTLLKKICQHLQF